MGILNVTPDSFSDGGRFLDRDDAVAHGVAMRAAGRGPGRRRRRVHPARAPRGSTPRSRSERVLPVIRDLVADGRAGEHRHHPGRGGRGRASRPARRWSTTCPAGWPTRRWPPVVAAARVPWILMHWRGPSARMNALAGYEDVVGEVRAELVARVDAAVLAGVDPARLVLDPGLGFAKTAAHNWALLRRLDVLRRARASRCWSAPPASGSSASCWPTPTAPPRRTAGREVATAAVTALAARGRRLGGAGARRRGVHGRGRGGRGLAAGRGAGRGPTRGREP